MRPIWGSHNPLTETEKNRRLEAAFRRVVAAADVGERCPENGTQDINAKVLGDLARAGRIRILIADRNYRTVEILEGPSAGKSTKAYPRRSYPWKVIDKNGTRVNGKLQYPKSSAPITLAKVTLSDADA